MKILAACGMALALSAGVGLTPQTADTFDVVAIHPSSADSMNTQIQIRPGGRLVIANATLRTLIRSAYGVLPFQLTGEPKWSEADHFDINAKNASGEEITQDSMRSLMQGLLADRFQLKTHWETRQEPIYALVVNDRPKFEPYVNAPQRGMNSSRVPGKINMRATDVSMTQLASELGFRLQRFVVDQTGLSGRYDFVLHWNPDTDEDSTEPSLSTALHEQLGLKLEPRKGPVPTLVIDSAAKPSEN
jgi:bla regulator protein BlaR1